MNQFDPQRDYFEDLKEGEKYKDEKGREYPYLHGLIRLAHLNRGGVEAVSSKIVKTPSLEKPDDIHQPDYIASVTVCYRFKDGTSFEGSADASFKAHGAPYNLHLVAVAEAKAEARAIRRAFMISKVAKEEVGSPADEVVGDPDNGPITDAQINGIRTVAKRKKLSQVDVCALIGRTDITDITQLTSGEARRALKAINKKKV